MRATKDHISSETAKLLKDCGIESEWAYYSNAYDNYETYALSGNPAFWKGQPNYPAYTWQEILWEYPVLFFGNEKGSEYYKSINILQKLQDKEYDEADQYFQDNCILIKK